MKKLIPIIFFGGCSTEYEISLQSAHAVLSHLDPEKYAPLMVGMTPDGHWLHYTGPIDHIASDTWAQDPALVTPCALSPERGRHELIVFGKCLLRLKFDAAFPVLHGKNGEDGTLQGLLELAGIPIIGCGTLASALAMDKARTHTLAESAGVSVPKGKAFPRGTAPEVIAAWAEILGYPVFVKPVRAGSSFGISRVTAADKLSDAVQQAFLYDDMVIIEQAVEGFEVGCAVLGNQNLITGRVDEIELSGGFFDFTEKYQLITSKIHCPARIAPETEEKICFAAKKIYHALGCKVFARVDMFLTTDGQILCNEVNTIPGFTAHSRYPGMMQAIGISFSALLDRMIALGMEGANTPCA